jgi:hypothetical protein
LEVQFPLDGLLQGLNEFFDPELYLSRLIAVVTGNPAQERQQ